MLTKAGTLIGHKVFLVNMAWIHTVHTVNCPANVILARLGGICRGKDNCLHVFVILSSAEGGVITFALSTNSSNTMHVVFWFSAGKSSAARRGNSAPKESAAMQDTVAPPQGGG